MKCNTILFIVLIFFLGCKENSKEKKFDSKVLTPNLISDFESGLRNLKNKKISSLDSATLLFQKYIAKTNNLSQKDSLFQPYFNFYNLGRKLLPYERNEVIEQFGFKKVISNGIEVLIPTSSGYLETNIIHHLSEPMQKFCNQQLKEFNEVKDLATIGSHAIWWENFNTEHPDFFLKETTTYHYKNWHLRNLLSGTEQIRIFINKNQLSENALKVYNELIANNSKTKTAKIIREYLDVLKKNDFIKTKEVKNFIKEVVKNRVLREF